MQSILVKALFDGEQLFGSSSVHFENGVITQIDQLIDHQFEINSKPNQKLNSNQLEGTLLPGYIDTQVNGGGGELFNTSPTVETLTRIAKAHQAFGTTGWLPTFISDSVEKMDQAADAVAQAIKDPQLGILGIHFEGPHLSDDKRGIHPVEFIRSLSVAEQAIYARQDLGKVVVTLAPEAVSCQQIQQLVKLGIIVSLGHSNASFEQTNRALAAGASGFTHLYNAMSQMNSRQPGLVAAALMHHQSFAGLILDNVHIHPAMAQLAIKNKSNIMLVTDAMPLVGNDENQFQFFTETINKKDNRLVNQQDQLAGSLLNMNQAVNNCINLLGMTLAEAIKLGCKNPARFLSLDKQLGSLQVGKKANMILLDSNGKIISSWVEGQLCYLKAENIARKTKE